MTTATQSARAPRSIILRIYAMLPYAFFLLIACCYLYAELAWGGISWQNPSAPYATGYEVFNPYVDFLLIPTVAGMLLLPLLLLAKLIARPRAGWRRWLPAIISYSLFFAFVALAVYMGWYID